MFPTIGNPGIQIIRTLEGAAVEHGGYRYLINDDLEIGFDVSIQDPQGVVFETEWHFDGYTDVMAAVLHDIAARQKLAGAEDILFNYTKRTDDSDDGAIRAILAHCRTATARLALIQDMAATARDAYQAALTVADLPPGWR